VTKADVSIIAADVRVMPPAGPTPITMTKNLSPNLSEHSPYHQQPPARGWKSRHTRGNSARSMPLPNLFYVHCGLLATWRRPQLVSAVTRSSNAWMFLVLAWQLWAGCRDQGAL
jgi:hypothetical protein